MNFECVLWTTAFFDIARSEGADRRYREELAFGTMAIVQTRLELASWSGVSGVDELGTYATRARTALA